MVLKAGQDFVLTMKDFADHQYASEDCPRKYRACYTLHDLPGEPPTYTNRAQDYGQRRCQLIG